MSDAAIGKKIKPPLWFGGVVSHSLCAGIQLFLIISYLLLFANFSTRLILLILL